MRVNVAILLFPDVEVLDFAGPFEVFSTASRVALRDQELPEAPFSVFAIAQSKTTVRARGGLIVWPHYSIDDHPPVNALVVPGGIIDEPLHSTATIDWIRRVADRAQLVASVCTGAFLLGRAGLLHGLSATTHWEDIDALRAMLPDTRVIENQAWVDEGKIVTSAGISAGIDMSLHVVQRLLGENVARATARQIEYRWPDDSRSSSRYR
jgi:transcriptional regulator GlxA family with amidase domain